ncbi:hypothetical protein QNH46_17415 [Paenibacillus woosongensis]|uniref:Butirosin biosynthesis protein H N-terminal domain-containing protein n=1 Tax=Paenibacillus woosongensis TaxID=307580 RepID=A0AA95I4U9_9BACL|nr:hypothetical protein [Paenibacillus woosongensis]WHX47902.1 hypothetical protein QNH46_17415 [Paenibacillus woosongensis]
MKVLPLVYPTIDSLPQHSYIMSILEVNHQIDQLIFDKYIQLKVDEYKNGVAVLDYCEDDFLSFSQFKDESYLLTRREIDVDIIKFLVDHIEKEYYIFLHVDEYFLPFSKAYRKYNFGHGIMIYGYDEKKGTFNVVGYDISNKLSFNLVSYSELKESYERLPEYFKTNNDDYLKKIFMLKPKYVENNLNRDVLVCLITEYKHSKNTIKSFVKDYYTNCDTFFGISIYKVLIKYYKLALNDENINLLTKNLYVLIEHKKIMKARTAFFLKEMGVKDTELLECIDIFIKELQIAMNLNIKFNLIKDKKNILKILNILEQVYLKEVNFLNKLLTKAIILGTTCRGLISD